MKKGALLETIQQSLPVKLDVEYISLHLDNAFADALPQIYKLFPSVIDQYCDYMEVDVETAGGVYYSEIPVSVIHFSMPGSGIRDVVPTDDAEVFFVPETSLGIRTRGGLEVNSISGCIGYYVDHDKINFATKPGDNTKVGIKALIPISDRDEDYDIYLPPGAVNEIVKSALSLIMNTPPFKENNDKSGRQI